MAEYDEINPAEVLNVELAAYLSIHGSPFLLVEGDPRPRGRHHTAGAPEIGRLVQLPRRIHDGIPRSPSRIANRKQPTQAAPQRSGFSYINTTEWSKSLI